MVKTELRTHKPSRRSGVFGQRETIKSGSSRLATRWTGPDHLAVEVARLELHVGQKKCPDRV